MEADNEADGNKAAATEVADDPPIDPDEMELLKSIIPKVIPEGQPPATPKSGDKWGSTHLNGGSSSSESSAEDLDISRWSIRLKKKGGCPPSQTLLTSGARPMSTLCIKYNTRQTSHAFKHIVLIRSPQLIGRAPTLSTTATI